MKIFEPVQIGTITLKNRLIRAATWLGGAAEGEVTDELIATYAELAAGGCGLIVTGFAFVLEKGQMLPGMIGAESDARIPSLKRLTDAIHAVGNGCKVFCQLAHTGIARLPFVRSTYADTFAADETTDPFVEMGGTGETCPAASEVEIRRVIDAWVTAAKRCKEAGFDGVELHYAHGFGPGAWYSPLWNHREDDWGGDRVRRARYAAEVTFAVRKAVDDWPVTAKINCEDGLEGGITTQDAAVFSRMLAREGLDAVVVSGGSVAAPKNMGSARATKAGREEGAGSEGYFAAATARIRESAGIPVIGVGGWRTPAIMEKHLGKTCDAFAISRPLIIEPNLVNEWLSDPGFETGCTSCNKCLSAGPVICRRDEE